ncbi:MAG TPA: nitroreductase/quinone reductase family protein [Actinomycetota bacterium]|nr:nitroreductase/quinone reductase family protein [Actinomycetota bacterium]
MAATEVPIVRSFEPASRFRTLMRVGNAVMVPLLRSRLGARMHELALLSFVGRKSGRTFEVPVGYQMFEGDAVVLTASSWRINMRGGADVEIVHEGRRRPMHAELVDDPDEVARIYGAMLRRVGLSKASHVGLKVGGDRMPSHDELVHAIGGKRFVVRLTPR